MKRPDLLPPGTPMRTRVSVDMTSLPEVPLDKYETCQRNVMYAYGHEPPDTIWGLVESLAW
ncbi:MAG: hypothetical protein QM758_16430 [Armatimonas sp.]